jgi:hypothetical protein
MKHMTTSNQIVESVRKKRIGSGPNAGRDIKGEK